MYLWASIETMLVQDKRPWTKIQGLFLCSCSLMVKQSLGKTWTVVRFHS